MLTGPSEYTAITLDEACAAQEPPPPLDTALKQYYARRERPSSIALALALARRHAETSSSGVSTAPDDALRETTSTTSHPAPLSAHPAPKGAPAVSPSRHGRYCGNAVRRHEGLPPLSERPPSPPKAPFDPFPNMVYAEVAVSTRPRCWDRRAVGTMTSEAGDECGAVVGPPQSVSPPALAISPLLLLIAPETQLTLQALRADMAKAKPVQQPPTRGDAVRALRADFHRRSMVDPVPLDHLFEALLLAATDAHHAKQRDLGNATAPDDMRSTAAVSCPQSTDAADGPVVPHPTDIQQLMHTLREHERRQEEAVKAQWSQRTAKLISLRFLKHPSVDQDAPPPSGGLASTFSPTFLRLTGDDGAERCFQNAMESLPAAMAESYRLEALRRIRAHEASKAADLAQSLTPAKDAVLRRHRELNAVSHSTLTTGNAAGDHPPLEQLPLHRLLPRRTAPMGAPMGLTQTSVRVLDLSGGYVGTGRVVGVAVAALVGACPNVHTLNIEGLQLHRDGMRQLVSRQGMGQHPSLLRANLRGNFLEDQCLRCLCASVDLASTSDNRRRLVDLAWDGADAGAVAVEPWCTFLGAVAGEGPIPRTHKLGTARSPATENLRGASPPEHRLVPPKGRRQSVATSIGGVSPMTSAIHASTATAPGTRPSTAQRPAVRTVEAARMAASPSAASQRLTAALRRTLLAATVSTVPLAIVEGRWPVALSHLLKPLYVREGSEQEEASRAAVRRIVAEADTPAGMPYLARKIATEAAEPYTKALDRVAGTMPEATERLLRAEYLRYALLTKGTAATYHPVQEAFPPHVAQYILVGGGVRDIYDDNQFLL